MFMFIVYTLSKVAKNEIGENTYNNDIRKTDYWCVF